MFSNSTSNTRNKTRSLWLASRAAFESMTSIGAEIKAIDQEIYHTDPSVASYKRLKCELYAKNCEWDKAFSVYAEAQNAFSAAMATELKAHFRVL